MTDNEQQGQEKPKIIVDNDWKAQAEAEKDRLSKQEQAAPAGAEGTAVGGPAELPPVSFATLVGSLATQVFLALGGMEGSQDKEAIRRPGPGQVPHRHADDAGGKDQG